MEAFDLVRHHIDKVSDRLTDKLALQGANSYNRPGEQVIQTDDAEPVVVV
jgi:hypothetical protein